MRLWVLLALVSLTKAEITTTTTTETTVREGSETKEKRTPADETSLQNPQYEGYSDEEYQSQQRTQIQNVGSQSPASAPTKNQIAYFVQGQHQIPSGAVTPQAPSSAQVSYIPLRTLLEAQGQFPRYNVPYTRGEQYQPGGTTFTVQYVPASSIYRSAGNSQKYELVSKTQQAPIKTPNQAIQNSLVYLAPGQGHPYLYSNPQYAAAQTYIQPQYTHPPAYVAPSQASAQSPGGIVYTLQPVVMSFALPGSHNQLLPVFGGNARGTVPPVLYYPYQSPAVHPAVSYAPQRQQVAYVLPSSPANQRLQQQAATAGSSTSDGSNYASPAAQNTNAPVYRVHSQSTPQFQQVKG